MTRLCPALLAAMLVACQPAGQDPQSSAKSDSTGAGPGDSGLCEAEARPIGDVQGSGFTSPLEGQIVTVRGVVTLADVDDGLFVQEPRPFSPDRVSHGLFIAAPLLAETVSKGDLLVIRGEIGEIGDGEDTLTAIVDVHRHAGCGPGPEPPVFDARLPLTPEERESFEGMHLLLEQPLTVTAVSDVSEGRIAVSALGMLRAPTEVAAPGPDALAQQGKNRAWSLPVRNEGLRKLDPYTRIHAGALFNVLSGVLGHDGRRLSLIAEGALEPIELPAAQVPQAAESVIRAAGFNVHEYFNGDGSGGGFPGQRGARSSREFELQAARITAAVARIRPDVLAVMELENDGFGPLSAVRALSDSLTEALGTAFEVAEPESDRVGTDAISVGLLYRPERLEANGPARLLEGGSFGPKNRVPLAQTFTVPGTNIRFVVVANHLKSKGYCPDSGRDINQGDGQACWNQTRLEGALETVRWSRQLAAEAGTEHILLLGDFNAYRLEDPVRAILDEGLVELVEHHHSGMPLYSYIYRGAAGTLDYAFASESLAAMSSDAFIWHINAAYPWSGRPTEDWLRSSDHDPVVVDLRFSQAATSD